jgi:3-phenylpropionate/cinnamic acid dioxygenase small subunit
VSDDVSSAAEGADISPVPDDRTTELERRLQQLEDRQAVERLVSRYTSALDERRFDEYEDCFTDDAVLNYSWGSITGSAGLAARVEDALVPFSYTQHLTANLEVELHGDMGRGRANFFVTMIKRDDPDGKFWHEVGFYRHEYRRTRHGWRFSRLDAVSELRYRGPARPARAESPSQGASGVG